uniref:Uncharacterized protein n=1 Tax=Sphenodon punctatus TaxID=8508 RepID=A0A8D0H692_SPHPU
MQWQGMGAGAITKRKLADAKYKKHRMLDMFKTNLEEFGSKHKQEICKNSQFRIQFQDMCATISVCPLASSKGFWSEI